MRALPAVTAVIILASCGKSQPSAPDAPPAPAAPDAPSAASPDVPGAPQSAQPPTYDAPANSPNPAWEEEMRAAIEAGTRIRAVKAYQSGHPEASLLESRLAVDIEMDRLGKPSAHTIRRAIFEGEPDRAVEILSQLLSASPEVARSQVEQLAAQLLPANADRVAALVAEGKIILALAVQHHLYPDKSLGENKAAVDALSGRR